MRSSSAFLLYSLGYSMESPVEACLAASDLVSLDVKAMEVTDHERPTQWHRYGGRNQSGRER